MRNFLTFLFLFTAASCCGSCLNFKSDPVRDTIMYSDTIQYHPVRIDKTSGAILPWFSSDQGISYDTILVKLWNFWDKMELDENGLKYYMNHQVWKPAHDFRGIGGDQVSMALSSWTLLYAYTGNRAIVENMKYMADTYLERSLSLPTDKWPNIPYPYNLDLHSGKFDGDMRNGAGYTQPDKAGNFGYELVNLYKITGEMKYLLAARRIAKTLMENLIAGDDKKSPLPFRVNAKTGETGSFFDNYFLVPGPVWKADNTSNWSGTMLLFEALAKSDVDLKDQYQQAFTTILNWMKTYPLKTNLWGPFFEDIPGWSDTQINAITFAMFIMQHRELFPNWQKEVKGIFTWTYKVLGNKEYKKYKVEVMNEQTVYLVPGNSHSSRQASAELIYTQLSGDTTYRSNAIRTLNWATYCVSSDGWNRYIRDDIWLTDGYGDYVRHFLRAMAAMPELAPSNKNRLLSSSSIVKTIVYKTNLITYSTFDSSTDELRLVEKPLLVVCDGVNIESGQAANQYTWKPLTTGGVLQINHKGKNVSIRCN